jgi:hypothetical protein
MIRVGAEITGFTTNMKNVMDQLDDVGDKVESKLESFDRVGGRLVMAGRNCRLPSRLPARRDGAQGSTLPRNLSRHR